MFFPIFVMIVVGFAAYTIVTNSLNGKLKQKYPQHEISHKFHEPVGEYEDNHADRIGKKLIAHPEPEPGYIVLNGIKHRIEDCKYL